MVLVLGTTIFVLYQVITAIFQIYFDKIIWRRHLGRLLELTVHEYKLSYRPIYASDT